MTSTGHNREIRDDALRTRVIVNEKVGPLLRKAREEMVEKRWERRLTLIREAIAARLAKPDPLYPACPFRDSGSRGAFAFPSPAVHARRGAGKSTRRARTGGKVARSVPEVLDTWFIVHLNQ